MISIGGDEYLRAAVGDAVLQGLGAEAAEHDAVNGADPGTGQHGDGQLGDHGQVQGYPVALLHPVGLEDVGETADLGVQLLVGERPDIILVLTLPDDGRLVLAPVLQVAVQAVVGDVKLAALEPLYDGVLPVPAVKVGPPLEPVQLVGGHLPPELFRVLHRLLVHLFVLLKALDVRLLAELLGWREPPNLFHYALDGLSVTHSPLPPVGGHPPELGLSPVPCP
ncbi:MAG: hypothetical protein A4E29_00822 [Methanomassiliicoccales archaeon PtaB.Bin134]|nr:MAG: hypothetical protein A4E29_00822 [Methanomassiliicoccales archaeon PtaB.Bin134]